MHICEHSLDFLLRFVRRAVVFQPFPWQGRTALNAKFATRAAINAHVAKCEDVEFLQKLTWFLILVRVCDCNHMFRAKQCCSWRAKTLQSETG